MTPPRSTSANSRAVIVEPPRARDAMTLPLRKAYPRRESLPDDWMECLAKIDVKTSQT